MDNKTKLKEMLKDIIKIIEGPYIVADGCLLGIIREGDLLEFDNDVDLYIFPGTKINWDKLPDKYKYYKDYMCYKISDGEDKVVSENEWLRFVAYKRTCFQYIGYNRSEICQDVAKYYKYEKIDKQYGSYWIDVFNLVYDDRHNLYRIPFHWRGQEFYFTPSESEGQHNDTLGFDIVIPKNPKEVLKRIYGSNYMVENRTHQY